jgi:cysteinyl-tRNA synthetase
MPIFIYNSLSRKKEEFIPLKPPGVNIYTCGVTVYDESHIGHARSLYIFDLIRRYLKYRGFKVKFVRNITDIDDKIINRANGLKIGWLELVSKYIVRYYEDLKLLGIEKADFEPRATENIKDMVKHIAGLIKKGFAYESGGDVYFNVRKFLPYGKLSGQSIDEMEKGVRIEPSENKRDPLDFTLWKRSKEGEPAWDSPWSKGRPGWHIECSVMSQKFLKAETLDIHAGGRDLIFPHHENEIAQAQALTGKPFAKYWIHHGLLTINGQKMAKSLGNFVTIKDFISRYDDANLLKFFFLSAHYSHPMDYSDKKIEEAKQALQRIIILIDRINSSSSVVRPLRGGFASLRSRPSSVKKIQVIEDLKNKFIAVMDDDFNTPQALACIFELVSLGHKNIEDRNFALCAKKALEELLGILGVSIKQVKISALSDKEIEARIQERQQARLAKDYALSDKIRKELEGQGVILEDEKEKTIWRRKL